MKKAISTTLVLFLSSTGLALASGPTSIARDSFGEQEALMVTETIRCVVTEIRPDGTILVKDTENESVHPLPYNERTRIVAQDRTEFDRRKKLETADLEVGREIKVTVRPATMEVVRIKVLRKEG